MDEEARVETGPTYPAARSLRKFRSSDGGWQAEKSHLMRMHLLDATMQCLIEFGYTQTTTEKIAKRAGVSRGAMTHHFKSRADVFAAAAAHIADIRVAAYDEAIEGVAARAGSYPTFESMRETLKALQDYYMQPSFLAYHELMRGARTDPLLKEIMEPLDRSIDERISESMVKRFPIWSELDLQETGQVLRDLIMHSLQGVALDPSSYLQGDRLDRLHDLLAKLSMNEFHEACMRHGRDQS